MSVESRLYLLLSVMVLRAVLTIVGMVARAVHPHSETIVVRVVDSVLIRLTNIVVVFLVWVLVAI